MADYKLWNALKDAKKYRWVELSHSLNNESPYWSGIPEGSVELAKTVWDWGKPELECLIQTFKFPGQFGTHIDFPGHFIKGKALSEKCWILTCTASASRTRTAFWGRPNTPSPAWWPLPAA